jgi:hypothetical protein
LFFDLGSNIFLVVIISIIKKLASNLKFRQTFVIDKD